MKNFAKDLQKFKEKIERKDFFSLARYGDGELSIVEDKFIDILNKCNGEFNYDPKSSTDQEHREKLIKAFTYRDEGYYIGIACPCCVGHEKHLKMKKMSDQEESNLTWANILVNGNYRGFLTEVVPLFNNYDVYMVINEKANIENLPFKDSVVKNWKIGSNAWKADNTLVNTMGELDIKDSIFLFAAKSEGLILLNLFLSKNSSSTLQSTSTIALPIPKIFILSFFRNNRFCSIWVARSAYFAT